MKKFWESFYKVAYDTRRDKRVPKILERSVTEGGPRLDALSVASDRGRWRIENG